MTVDNAIGSPYQDRIYVTWTEFAADGTGYIWAPVERFRRELKPRVFGQPQQPLMYQHYGLPTPQGNCNEKPVLAAVHGPTAHCTSCTQHFHQCVAEPITATLCCWSNQRTVAPLSVPRQGC